jgi:outer membrane lipoprotein-sorting protein
MFLPESIKFFVGFAVIFASSCGFWQGAENQNTNVSPAPLLTAEESKSAIPFSTKEPDVYQTEIVLTNYAGGEKSERKIFTARRGEKIRCDYENKISFLQIGEGQRFSIHNDKKIYAENQAIPGVAGETSNPTKDFLTVEWLNEKRGAMFENLGTENNLTKYLVRLEDALNAASETLIFVDENLKIPVRQEFYTTGGEQKILVFSMKLENLKLDADDKLFELPKDFRKVSRNEFQKTIRLEKLNAKND